MRLLSSDTLYCDAPATCFVMYLPDYDTKEFLRFETVKYIYDLSQCIRPNVSMSMYLTCIRWILDVIDPTSDGSMLKDSGTYPG